MKRENYKPSNLLKEADGWFGTMAVIHVQVFHEESKMEIDRKVGSRMYTQTNASWIENLGSIICFMQAIVMREAQKNGWGPNLNIIDWGCGENELVNRIMTDPEFRQSWSPFDPQAVGYDFLGQGKRIQEAHAKYPGAREYYVNWNFIEQSFPDSNGSVHVAYSNAFTQYLTPEDLKWVLQDLNRLLVDGGVLYFITRRECNKKEWDNVKKKFGLRVRERPDLGPHGYELYDKKIRNGVGKIDPDGKSQMSSSQKAGYRPYYAHPTGDVIKLLKACGFEVINDAPTPIGGSERAVHEWLTNGGKPSNGFGVRKIA